MAIKAGCYCRVSTKKEEQLQSLAMQKQYFTEYCEKNNEYELYEIYADEGISGKSLKNRKEFDRMIKDALKGNINVILVKDFARFARNTVDLLSSIRNLKERGIEVIFLNYNMTSAGDSEFIVTVMAAIAQEESAMLSKKLKLSKSITAQRGRVPNFAFGYDYNKELKTLIPNEEEVKWVNRIFQMYVNEAMGTAKIAEYLNINNVKTKKNIESKGWTQRVITSILRNELYIGRVINKKSEVTDFKTGKRKQNGREDWIIVEKPELRIIDEELFNKAQAILESRKESFRLDKKRPSNKYPLSNLVVCANDGYSFRRCERQYSHSGRVYRWWTCTYRNARGASMCDNNIRLDEEQMHRAIIEFLQSICSNKETVTKQIKDTVSKELARRFDSNFNRKELLSELKTLEAKKNRLVDLYTDGEIGKDYLVGKLKPISSKIEEITTSLSVYENYENIEVDIEKSVLEFINRIEYKAESLLNNAFLKSIFDKFIVHPDGKINAILKIDYDADLSMDIPFGEMQEEGYEKIVPNYNNST